MVAWSPWCESHNNQLCDYWHHPGDSDGQDVDAGPEDGKRSFNFRCKIICRQNWEVGAQVYAICFKWVDLCLSPSWLKQVRICLECQRPGLGRSPGEGHGNPLQCHCLENPMNWGAWRATVHGVAKNQTQLRNWACTYKPYPRIWSISLSWKNVTIRHYIVRYIFILKNE